MAEQKINLIPGVNSVATPTLNSAGWSESNLIRYQNGFLQPVGGWQRFSDVPVIGTARTMKAWLDLDGNKYLAVGTNERLQLYSAGVQYDITPYVATNTLTTPFSTTSGSATVEVEDTAHGGDVGDWIYIELPVSVGGLILFGYYAITSVIDVDNYTIEAASLATATVSGGGATPEFTTTNTSPDVMVTLEDHGYTTPGSIFTVQFTTAVGGLNLVGEYVITSIPDADNFVIDAGSNASSDDSAFENGGDVDISYLLPIGPSSNETLTGWGGGGWGTEGWGTSTAVATINPMRVWSLDNFGEILLANPTNLGLYSWQPPVSTGNVATAVGTAPTMNTGMFVAMPQAQVIVYGAETGAVQDLLLIRWSDTGSYSNFTPTASNQAGSFRLSRGSRIVGGMQAAQTALIWTDVDLWSMIYQGAPFVYSINTVSQNCGLIGQLAATTLANNVYWMSLKGFFQMQGNSVGILPCDVWDNVFADLDTDNQNKCLAAANTPFNEVWFFYPSLSGGTGEIDSYAKVQVGGPKLLWDYGSLIRTAWMDQSLFGMPIGIDATGTVQQHEIGYTDNGTAIPNVYGLSGYADIAEGQDMPFIDQLIPDFKYYDTDATADFSVYGTNYPMTDPTVFGPFPITTTTRFITMRARKRQMAFRVDFDGQSFVRLGAVRYRIAPSGRRPT